MKGRTTIFDSPTLRFPMNMSSPNHSVRYEIRSTGGSASLQHICCSVQAEGGEDALGLLRYVSTAGTHVDANVENTIYAIVGIRLKSTHLDTTVRLLNAVMQIQTSPDSAEWLLIFNPTVAGTFTRLFKGTCSILSTIISIG